MNDSIIALIRTIVPAAIGSAIAFAADKGIDIDIETQTALAAAAVAVIISAYYAVATLLERKVNENFGWLLGYAKAPTYTTPPAPVVEDDPNDDELG